MKETTEKNIFLQKSKDIFMKIVLEWKKIWFTLLFLIVWFLVEYSLLYVAYNHFNNRIYDIFIVFILILNLVHFEILRRYYLKRENTKTFQFFIWYYCLYFAIIESVYQVVKNHLLYNLLDMSERTYILFMILFKNISIIIIIFEVLFLLTTIFFLGRWIYKQTKKRLGKSKS